MPGLAQDQDRVAGALLGVALGDAFGAPYEGGWPERVLWRLVGTRRGRHRWTDDTQMTIDVTESLLQCGGIDQDDLASRFAESYRWSRGYGPGAARILRRIRRGEPWQSASRAVYTDGSYGNGAAMRSAAIGLFFAARGDDEVAAAAAAAAVITHAHPLGREGAVLMALATAYAFRGGDGPEIVGGSAARARSPEFSGKLAVAAEWLAADRPVDPPEVARELGNGIAATQSCATAIYLAVRFLQGSFRDLTDFVARMGGDVDTIGAMAGGVWGAANGAGRLPEEMLAKLEDNDRLTTLAARLKASIPRASARPD